MSKNKNQPLQRQKLLIKRGDLVQVITGKDKGSKGKVLNVDREKLRIVVEGVNIVTKHIKPTSSDQQGKIEKMEAPIHYSNVLLFCEKSGKGERVRVQANEDGSKTRFFVQSNVKVD